MDQMKYMRLVDTQQLFTSKDITDEIFDIQGPPKLDPVN